MRPKPEVVIEGKSEVAVTGKECFGVRVLWPKRTRSWNDTVGEVARSTGITRYALYVDSGSVWEYRLDVTTAGRGSYKFYDESGNIYDLQAHRDGDHHIRFNSKQPTIIYVTGG